MNLQIDKKNLFLIGIVILVIAIGGIVEFNNQSALNKIADQPTPMPAASQNNSEKKYVTFTQDGFVPKEITVTSGTTVIWTNKTNNPMWVASDPHPSHTDLKGFDEREIVYTHATYQYTFTAPGKWKYHNHIIPSYRGTVEVTH